MLLQRLPGQLLLLQLRSQELQLPKQLLQQLLPNPPLQLFLLLLKQASVPGQLLPRRGCMKTAHERRQQQ